MDDCVWVEHTEFTLVSDFLFGVNSNWLLFFLSATSISISLLLDFLRLYYGLRLTFFLFDRLHLTLTLLIRLKYFRYALFPLRCKLLLSVDNFVNVLFGSINMRLFIVNRIDFLRNGLFGGSLSVKRLVLCFNNDCSRLMLFFFLINALLTYLLFDLDCLFIIDFRVFRSYFIFYLTMFAAFIGFGCRFNDSDVVFNL